MRDPGLSSRLSANNAPVPRPIVVATAAPVTPSRGNGPSPKIRQGPSRMLIAFASQSTRIAIAASPAPRKIALITNSMMIVDVAAEHDARVRRCPSRARRTTRPSTRSSARREHRAGHAEHERDAEREQNCLAGGLRRAVACRARRCAARPSPTAAIANPIARA